ncbi:MAG: glycosyltransferase family 2 protein [Christensenellaceae bacterium]|jgi:glucosyltransferase
MNEAVIEMTKKHMISVVVPCYNEAEALPYFFAAMEEVMEGFSSARWELIFIDDGSKDESLHIIKEYASMHAYARYAAFSRNFGKEAAMYAGLKLATGDYVVIMDADLQDPPVLLKEMYNLLQTGEYDCVATRRVTRKGEPPIRSFFARMFYRLMRKISKIEMVDGARDFRMMTRIMVDAVLSMEEKNRFSKGLFAWVGFRTKWLEYENVARVAGETKWSFWKLLMYSFNGIFGFSTMPLQIASVFGLFFCALAIIMIFIVVGKTILFGDPVSGWPSLMSVILLIGGIQLFSIGILGQYLAKTFIETKNRPLYIIREAGGEIENDEEE